MPRPSLALLLLVVTAFGLASGLEPESQAWRGEATGSGGMMAAVFGESRKMFARHVSAKADAYFHRGYYPSVFDEKDQDRGAAVAGAQASHTCEFLSPPKDWIDRFGRHFYPSEHRHLGEGAADHGDHEGHCEGHGHEHESGECEHGTPRAGEEREMLPWLKLAADLDPSRVETYVVGTFWLRSQLKKVDEAEQFVRLGLKANPGSPDLLFELGRIYQEDRNEPDRARNLWELALVGWAELSEEEQQPRALLYAQLLGNLAKLEENAGNTASAIGYLERLREVSPNRTYIEAWIEELRP